MHRRAHILALLDDELRADRVSGETRIRAEDVRAATVAALSQLDGALKGPHPAEARDIARAVSDTYEDLGYVVLEDEYDLDGLCDALRQLRSEVAGSA